MPKLKLVGSKDGKPGCEGCYYHSIVNPREKKRWSCVKPESAPHCVTGQGKLVRYNIFVEDKETTNKETDNGTAKDNRST